MGMLGALPDSGAPVSDELMRGGGASARGWGPSPPPSSSPFPTQSAVGSGVQPLSWGVGSAGCGCHARGWSQWGRSCRQRAGHGSTPGPSCPWPACSPLSATSHPCPPPASGRPSPLLAGACPLQLSLSLSLSASLSLALGGRWMSGVYTLQGRRAGWGRFTGRGGAACASTCTPSGFPSFRPHTLELDQILTRTAG